MNTATSQLLPIPPGLSAADLLNAINDRLRRIQTTPATASTTAATTTTTASAELAQITVGTSPYDIPANVDVVTFASGAGTATLPALAGLKRKPLWLINATSGSITLNCKGSDTLNGNGSLTLYAGGRYQLMPNA
jgi:hypothetical protein